MAFFRMELYASDIFFFHCYRECIAVISSHQCILLIVHLYMEGMRKIEPGLLKDCAGW